MMESTDISLGALSVIEEIVKHVSDLQNSLDPILLPPSNNDRSEPSGNSQVVNSLLSLRDKIVDLKIRVNLK